MIEYTDPPTRQQEDAPDVAKLPETLPGLMADPAAYRGEEVLIGALAERLCTLPDAAAAVPSTDGEVEVLGGVRFTHRFVDAPGDSEVVRWHLVEAGPADRSYGIEVAKLAGLPNEVIDRAREVLLEHESAGERFTALLANDSPEPREAAQLTIFTPLSQPVLDRLREVEEEIEAQRART